MSTPTFLLPPSVGDLGELLQLTIDHFPDPIFVKDLQHRWIACNQAFGELIGQPHETILGQSDDAFFPTQEVAIFWRLDDQVINAQQPFENEEQLTDHNGIQRTIWTRKFPLVDSSGSVIGLCGIITDISHIKQRQHEIEHLEQQIQDKMGIITAQESMLDQMAVPVIQVWEHILLLPLIGMLDSRRILRVTDDLLTAITHEQAQFVILDVTGVPIVDTSVASHLIHAVQAAELLGCQSILVGISPDIAQTLVGLGIDFSHIMTKAALQQGLEYALHRLHYAITRLS